MTGFPPRNFQHIRQSSQARNCGAACLAMLLHYYRKKGKLQEITDKISVVQENGAPSCRNYLIVQYVESRDFTCCVVSAKNAASFIPFCLSHGIELILSYYPDENSWGGHFVLVTGCDEDHVYVNDPEISPPEGVNLKISLASLAAKMKSRPNGEITRDNVFVLISPKTADRKLTCINVNTCPPHSFWIFPEILPEINSILDPYKDIWVPVQWK